MQKNVLYRLIVFRVYYYYFLFIYQSVLLSGLIILGISKMHIQINKLNYKHYSNFINICTYIHMSKGKCPNMYISTRFLQRLYKYCVVVLCKTLTQRINSFFKGENQEFKSTFLFLSFAQNAFSILVTSLVIVASYIFKCNEIWFRHLII